MALVLWPEDAILWGMRYQLLPGTELSLSVIALGTGEFGGAIPEPDAFALMDGYVAAGGNFIDTASIYADWRPGERSSSEKILGRWLKTHSAPVVVATKGGHPALAPGSTPRLSREELTLDLEASRRNLGLERIDFYWLHRDDPGRPVLEILETLEAFVQSGKIRYYGFSNWTLARAREARQIAQAQGYAGFAASQLLWSLAEIEMTNLDTTLVSMTPDFYRWHAEVGLAAVPYSSQASGYFSKWAQGVASSSLNQAYDSLVNQERGRRLLALAETTSLSLTQLVLGWLTSQPFPVFPIIGPKTLEQLADSLTAGDTVLPRDVMHSLAPELTG